MVLAWDGKLGGDDPTLIETFRRHARRYLCPDWVLKPMVAALIAAVLILSFGQRASALDCLAYKPAGARGQWHADVVAGKICWYGPNWRSFLPKPKLQSESAQAVKSKPDSGAAPLSRSAEPALGGWGNGYGNAARFAGAARGHTGGSRSIDQCRLPGIRFRPARAARSTQTDGRAVRHDRDDHRNYRARNWRPCVDDALLQTPKAPGCEA